LFFERLEKAFKEFFSAKPTIPDTIEEQKTTTKDKKEKGKSKKEQSKDDKEQLKNEVKEEQVIKSKEVIGEGDEVKDKS